MGTSWRLAANGTTPGNLYGLAWTHTNVGGQSKAGLSHQLLVMENGLTKVALGSGVWTNYTSYFPYIYDTDNTGYYLDPNGSSYSNYFGRNYGFNWTEYDWNNAAYYVDPNNVSIFSDVRAQIFYDYNNTGYYADMNNGSNFNYATANDWYVNSWYRVNGGGGIYWQAYGGGWNMQDASYLRVYGNKTILSQCSVYPGAQIQSLSPSYYGLQAHSYDNNTGAGLYVMGYAYAYTYYTYSTREKKKEIEKFEDTDYSSALAFMDKLDLNYYKYKAENDYPKIHVGLIAEETPITLTAPGQTGVSYSELSIFNTGAIKELKSKRKRA